MKAVKLAIVSSQFWSEIVQNLEKTCIKTLEEDGLNETQVDLFKVPGSLEIPLVVKKLAKKKIYQAIIVFGVILKGETYHFEQVARECLRGCMDVSLEYEIPVIYEVLAVYDLKDAIKRASLKKAGHGFNKGTEAAEAAIKMIELLSKI